MRALDLFCGAGGASRGLAEAGFEVTGVDLAAQKRYPYTFVQADACTYPIEGFDLVWASPPCQRYSQQTRCWKGAAEEHPDLVAPIRERLITSGIPYIIENVEGAPMTPTVVLCGSSFGLQTKDGSKYLRRHRLFETTFPVTRLACAHGKQALSVTGNGGGSSRRDQKHFGNAAQRREVMGIDWMNNAEIAQAVPPAYAAYLAKEFLRSL